jgi:hypothetical protein
VTGEPEFRNGFEFQLFGLQRSGNHAFSAWLFQQFEEPVYFFNNIDHFADPILCWRQGPVPNTVRLKGSPAGRAPAVTDPLRLRPKRVLALSYENLDLRRLQDRPLIEDREELLGASRAIHRILLLRDFFNWVASRLRLFQYRGATSEEAARHVIPHLGLWIVYAREFVGETAHLGHSVKVQYNRWADDPDYRLAILDALAVPVRDNGTHTVPDVGGGSSFDSTSFSGRASQMDVHERWRYLLRPEWGELREVLARRSPEIDRYNTAIFGLATPPDLALAPPDRPARLG